MDERMQHDAAMMSTQVFLYDADFSSWRNFPLKQSETKQGIGIEPESQTGEKTEWLKKT